MKCEICGTPLRVYYPEFRAIEYQCDCHNPVNSSPDNESVFDEHPIFWDKETYED